MSDESGQGRSVTVGERGPQRRLTVLSPKGKGRMTVVAFLEAARQEVHDRILRDVSDRTHEQFLWRPNPGMSNIAYLLWHVVRIEDITIQTQFRKAPLIYEAEEWANRLGLDPRLRPPGLTPKQMDAVVYRLENFSPYAHKVWNNTSEVLRGMQDEDLEQPVNIEDLPQATNVGALFRAVLVSHPWRHLGEILYIKQLQELALSSGGQTDGQDVSRAANKALER